MRSPLDSPPAPPTLSDGRVVLRALQERDIEGCYEQCVDPESVRWTSVPTPFSLDDARQYCLEIAPAAWADGSQWIFAVEAAVGESGGGYAGNIALRDQGHGRAALAFGAHPAARGRGVTEAAVRLLLKWGFEQQGVRVVTWEAVVGNWASRRLAWRLGFSHDGVLRGTHAHRGRLVDAWHGTLHAGEPREPRHRWLAPPPLAGDGVRLRAFAEGDLARVVEACRDERTQHWLGKLPSPYTEADARGWYAACTERQATGTGTGWAVTDATSDPATSPVLASIDLFDVTEHDAEIGFWTHPDSRGCGVMTAALRMVTSWAFAELGLRRVRTLAALDNAASRHVIEACGYQQTGVARLGTRLRTGLADAACYDVLAEEWAGTVPAAAGTAASARR